jgi:hypothetical protein
MKIMLHVIGAVGGLGLAAFVGCKPPTSARESEESSTNSLPVSQVGGDTLGTGTTSWLGYTKAGNTFAENTIPRTDIKFKYETPKVGVQGKSWERVPRWVGVESIHPVENCRWASEGDNPQNTAPVTVVGGDQLVYLGEGKARPAGHNAPDGAGGDYRKYHYFVSAGNRSKPDNRVYYCRYLQTSYKVTADDLWRSILKVKKMEESCFDPANCFTKGKFEYSNFRKTYGDIERAERSFN